MNIINDVMFVMDNLKLNKKDVRKTNYYNIDDLSSNDEWTM